MTELSFVTFAPRHVSARVAWLNDPQVRAGVPIQGHVNEDSTIAWTKRVSADSSRADFVLEGSVRQPLVMCGITQIDEEARRGELYMFADPAIHGQGFGSAALARLCMWSFDQRRLNRVFLFTFGHNSAARRFYERAGFVQEGRLREHSFHEGRLVDRYVHGLLARDWRAIDTTGVNGHG